MKLPLFLSVFLVACNIAAQDLSHIYVVGTAVPGGIQELTPFPNSKFKFAGSLRKGTLRITNTPEPRGIQTRYFKSSHEDSYVVTDTRTCTLVRDSTGAEWTVPFTEDRYRFTVDTSAKSVQGELFTPWNELFIVGGATECGWVTYTFLPFTRDETEVCAWEWTGELRERPEYGEPRRFKFNGQNAWDPNVLHPFTKDENILRSSQVLTGGTGDNKWSVTDEGIYHIRVDVFRETVQAAYLGPSPTENQQTAIHSPSVGFTLRTQDCHFVVESHQPCLCEVYASDGRPVCSAAGTLIQSALHSPGLYIFRITVSGRTLVRKLVVD